MSENTMTEKELSEVLQVRRDKLKALQEAGNNPYEITKFDFTHYSKDVIDSFEDGQEIIIEDGVAKLPDRSFYAGSLSALWVRQASPTCATLRALFSFTFAEMTSGLTSIWRSSRWILATL